MGAPIKRLRTDIGDELDSVHARSGNLTAHIDSVRAHGYIKRNEAEELVRAMDELELPMKDLRDSLTDEDGWE
ncbi:MAG: hypothetical protein J4F28_07235, partial [Nitrosopumilaceae archaeon]|nr:hypothetical protein [Nitrosopumilaceae archaeon]